MFKIEGRKIYLTRGDRVAIKITPKEGLFNIGDIIRFTVIERGKYNNIIINKIVEVSNPQECFIRLYEEDTKLFKNEIIVYNYEISYNGIETPIGYDMDGEKKLIVYPEVEVE